MLVVITPSSFKESLPVLEACKAIEEGFNIALERRSKPNQRKEPIALKVIPMADGGNGTLETLANARKSQWHTATVTGPMGQEVTARYITMRNHLWVFEMAEASGLHLVPLGQRNAMQAHTYGVGQLLKLAAQGGAKEVWLGLGGSASTDGGLGALLALGATFSNGYNVTDLLAGRWPAEPYSINLDAVKQTWGSIPLKLLADVENPILGPEGAAAVYGPQKGASPEQVALLDGRLEVWTNALQVATGQQIQQAVHTGAAGGLGAGLKAALNAALCAGAQFMIDQAKVKHWVRQADYVITTEGYLDLTSDRKGTGEVAYMAAQYNVPVICLVGGYDPALVDEHGSFFRAILPIAPGLISYNEAIENAAQNLTRTAFMLANLIITQVDAFTTTR